MPAGVLFFCMMLVRKKNWINRNGEDASAGVDGFWGALFYDVVGAVLYRRRVMVPDVLL